MPTRTKLYMQYCDVRHKRFSGKGNTQLKTNKNKVSLGRQQMYTHSSGRVVTIKHNREVLLYS